MTVRLIIRLGRCFIKEHGSPDELGLDIIDSRMIKTMIENFGGGPVGLDTLAATIGEEPNTIEDVYEPYLLQLGFISRTPRGRIATKAAYDHFDIPFAE